MKRIGIALLIISLSINVHSAIFIDGFKVMRGSSINKYFEQDFYVYIAGEKSIALTMLDNLGKETIYLESEQRNELRNILVNITEINNKAAANNHVIKKEFGYIKTKVYFKSFGKNYLPKKKAKIYFNGRDLGSLTPSILIFFDEVEGLEEFSNTKPNMIGLTISQCERLIYALSDESFAQGVQKYLKEKSVNDLYK